MREFSRRDRLADQIKREVADIIQGFLKDPGLGMITITDAEVTRDLRYAKIFYSVFGEARERRKSDEILKKSVGVIQAELARRIRIRSVPLISFEVDTSIEYGARMEALLKQIKIKRPEDDDDKSDKNEE